ncbi:MAG: hypothetical protein A2284_14670 [Deltaproteobacteria bacterium RIFOXYA12_FULL_61_11]|nr:MAG: hypothetical protein A2284_14670 [Deltaproteobacteria bacterium RIFOXYA12_FULL_61_11]
MLLRLALRNLSRHRRRTVLTGLTIVVGYVLMSFMLSLDAGTYGAIIEMFTGDHTGHVQVHARGYLDRPGLHKTVQDGETFGNLLESDPRVQRAAPRIYSSVLAFAGPKTTGLRLIGIDPDRERSTTRLAAKVSAGSFLPAEGNVILLGSDTAEVLGVGPGNEVVLVGQAADGSVANDLFTVAGLLGSSADQSERSNGYLPLRTAQEFLALGGRVHEWALRLTHYGLAEEVAQALEGVLDRTGFSGLEVDPWQVVEKEFTKTMEGDRKGNTVMQFIFVLIVALGVLNTVLMSLLERTREFGVLRSLGTSPGLLFTLLVLETGLLTLGALGVALVLAGCLNLYFQHYGIRYPEPMSVAGMLMDRMEGALELHVFLLPALTIFLTALLVSLYPAMRAATIRPVDALRTF